MKKERITKEQINDFNRWQQETGKKPCYGAIDIEQLDFSLSNLLDADLYEETQANKIAFDLLLLISNYLNDAQIKDAEELDNISEFSRVSVAIFKKLKPVFDNGLLNWAQSQQTGENLTYLRQQKQDGVGAVPVTLQEIEQYCIDANLSVDRNEIYKTYERTQKKGKQRVIDWKRYINGISNANRAKEHAKQVEQFRVRVLSEHGENNGK